MNTYFQYLDLQQAKKKYEEVFALLEEDGELTEEIEVKLMEAEESFETLAFDVVNLIDELKLSKSGKEKEIERLEKANQSVDNQVDYLKKFLQSLVKSVGEINKTGNKTLKVGTRNLSVTKSTSLNVSPDFDEEKFLSWQLKTRIDNKEYADRIKRFFNDREVEVEFDKVVDKRGLAKALKELKEIDPEAYIEGVEEITKDQLNIK